MKSGDISQDELMKEATEWMGKMKGMGGNEEFGDLFKNLAKNMGGLSHIINCGLFQICVGHSHY
jgi:hypothetical protein